MNKIVSLVLVLSMFVLVGCGNKLSPEPRVPDHGDRGDEIVVDEKDSEDTVDPVDQKDAVDEKDIVDEEDNTEEPEPKEEVVADDDFDPKEFQDDDVDAIVELFEELVNE